MRLAIALLVALATTAAAAQEAPATAPAHGTDSSRIDGQAGAAAQGLMGVNAAAGTSNAQANVRAIALGQDARAVASAQQAIDATGVDALRDAQALLGGGAFESTQGVLGLNQAAGGANAQLNLLAIGTDAMAVFGQQIDNAALAATRADAAPATAGAPSTAPLREARIDGTAVRAPAGVVQINQTAGVGNASANAIVLRLPGSTP